MPCYIAIVQIISFKKKSLKRLVVLSHYAAPFINDGFHAQEFLDGIQEPVGFKGGMGNLVHYLHQSGRLMFFYEYILGFCVHKDSF